MQQTFEYDGINPIIVEILYKCIPLLEGIVFVYLNAYDIFWRNSKLNNGTDHCTFPKKRTSPISLKWRLVIATS